MTYNYYEKLKDDLETKWKLIDNQEQIYQQSIWTEIGD